MVTQSEEGIEELLAHARNGTGPPAVFLHGLGSTRAQAEAAISGISGVEHITIDAPGHGGSANSAVPFDFGAFSRAVVEVLDRLDIESAIFGGISMGAGISLRVARDFPERVTALVLVRPAWVDMPGRPHLDIVADIGEWVVAEGPEAAHERLMVDDRYQLMLVKAPLSALSIEQAIDGVVATGRPDVLSEMVDSYPLDDLAELDEISQRALVIFNEQDPLHPPHIAKDIANGLANASLLCAPPRYLEPEAHQNFLTVVINSFIADHGG